MRLRQITIQEGAYWLSGCDPVDVEPDIYGTIAGSAPVYLCTTDCFKPEKALGLVFLYRRAASSTLNVPYSSAPFWSSSTRKSCCLIGFSTHKWVAIRQLDSLLNRKALVKPPQFMRWAAAYVVRTWICTTYWDTLDAPLRMKVSHRLPLTVSALPIPPPHTLSAVQDISAHCLLVLKPSDV